MELSVFHGNVSAEWTTSALGDVLRRMLKVIQCFEQ